MLGLLFRLLGWTIKFLLHLDYWLVAFLGLNLVYDLKIHIVLKIIIVVAMMGLYHILFSIVKFGRIYPVKAIGIGAGAIFAAQPVADIFKFGGLGYFFTIIVVAIIMCSFRGVFSSEPVADELVRRKCRPKLPALTPRQTSLLY